MPLFVDGNVAEFRFFCFVTVLAKLHSFVLCGSSVFGWHPASSGTGCLDEDDDGDLHVIDEEGDDKDADAADDAADNAQCMGQP